MCHTFAKTPSSSSEFLQKGYEGVTPPHAGIGVYCFGTQGALDESSYETLWSRTKKGGYNHGALFVARFEGIAIKSKYDDVTVPAGAVAMKKDQLAVAPQSMKYVSVTFLEDSLVSALSKELDKIGFTQMYHSAILELKTYCDGTSTITDGGIMKRVCNKLTTPFTPSPPVVTEAPPGLSVQTPPELEACVGSVDSTSSSADEFRPPPTPTQSCRSRSRSGSAPFVAHKKMRLLSVQRPPELDECVGSVDLPSSSADESRPSGSAPPRSDAELERADAANREPLFRGDHVQRPSPGNRNTVAAVRAEEADPNHPANRRCAWHGDGNVKRDQVKALQEGVRVNCQIITSTDGWDFVSWHSHIDTVLYWDRLNWYCPCF